MEQTRASVVSLNFVLLFQIIFNQKEPDHPSFYINIRSKGTFSSKKEPNGKVWYFLLCSMLSQSQICSVRYLCICKCTYFVHRQLVLKNIHVHNPKIRTSLNTSMPSSKLQPIDPVTHRGNL